MYSLDIHMGKELHKVFNDVVNDIYQALPILGESESYFSYFIPEPRNFAEVTRSSEDTKKPWLKATMKENNSLINNMIFLFKNQKRVRL